MKFGAPHEPDALREYIHTGAVIAQALIHPGPEDNFQTYPVLQLAAGLPLLRKGVLDSQRDGAALLGFVAC